MAGNTNVFRDIFVGILIILSLMTAFGNGYVEVKNVIKVIQGKYEITWVYWRALEAVAQRCSVKKVFLEISQNSQETTCARVSFLIKLQAETCNFIKNKTLAQVLFCEIWEISKNTFSYRTPPVAASGAYH